jgi:hypothetical protein
MASLDYNYTEIETFKQIADRCQTTVDQIMLLNNIQPPYSARPYDMFGAGGVIKVPQVYSGGETFENTGKQNNKQKYLQKPSSKKSSSDTIRPIVQLGNAVQRKCWIKVNETTLCFPCFPESYTDSHTASVTPMNILGRSEPFQIYQNSGPRTVSVSFRMDREMNRTCNIQNIIALVQSACYPIHTYPIIPRCTLVIGANCSITGIITDVSTDWGETLLSVTDSSGNQNFVYSVATLQFSVTECTGSPKWQPQVASSGGV